MRDEYDFSKAKRAKDIPHLEKLQRTASALVVRAREHASKRESDALDIGVRETHLARQGKARAD